MALPPVPVGYDSWNDYIETEAPAIALAQGITLQEAKASIKLLLVSKPIRSDVTQPYFRIYNFFTLWENRALLPELGRPWRIRPDNILKDRLNNTILDRNNDEIVTRN
jgi:hypothetical protein